LSKSISSSTELLNEYDKNFKLARCQWLTPIIPATQKAEIKTFKASPGKQFCKSLSRKTPHKNRASGVAQGEGPEFKSQYLKKKN
jgi:hypothetical protein